MWLILILLMAGSIAGYLLTKIKFVNPVSEKITGIIIYILLFFMGLSVGTSEEIMHNLDTLGLQALLISVFSILGSIFLAKFVYKLYYTKKQNRS